MFRVYGTRSGQEEVVGGEKWVKTYPTKEEAVAVAEVLIGLYDSLSVKDITNKDNPAVVWEMKNARSAPPKKD